MKKLIALVLALMLVSQISYARDGIRPTNTDLGEASALNSYHKEWTTPIRHRGTADYKVRVDDAATEPLWDSSVSTKHTPDVDCTAYTMVAIDVDITTNTGSWDLTPMFGNTLTETYFEGVKRTVSDDTRLYLDVHGTDRLYIICNGQSGSKSITVDVTPIR